MIKDVWWSGWVWVGECFFWYRPTRVVPDKRPLNGCVRVCELYTGMIHLETHQNMSSITTTLQSNRQEENSTRMVIYKSCTITWSSMTPVNQFLWSRAMMCSWSNFVHCWSNVTIRLHQREKKVDRSTDISLSIRVRLDKLITWQQHLKNWRQPMCCTWKKLECDKMNKSHIQTYQDMFFQCMCTVWPTILVENLTP